MYAQGGPYIVSKRSDRDRTINPPARSSAGPLSERININFKGIQAGVSVSCQIGEFTIEGSYDTIDYFKVSGIYKPGSAGSPDAYHIAGMMAYAQQTYFNRKWLLDLSELSYVWGDEMDMVLSMGDVPNLDLMATIVGPECIEAISTLSNPKANPRDCLKDEATFESFEEALAYLLEILLSGVGPSQLPVITN